VGLLLDTSEAGLCALVVAVNLEVGLYPIVTFQYSSTTFITSFQSYSVAVILKRQSDITLPRGQLDGGRGHRGGRGATPRGGTRRGRRCHLDHDRDARRYILYRGDHE
jgi:hypothetical protein